MVHKSKTLMQIPKERMGEMAKLVGDMGGALDYESGAQYAGICCDDNELGEEIADAVRSALGIGPEEEKPRPEPPKRRRKVKEEPKEEETTDE